MEFYPVHHILCITATLLARYSMASKNIYSKLTHCIAEIVFCMKNIIVETETGKRIYSEQVVSFY